MTPDRLNGLFASIDAQDTDSFLAHLTDDAVFRFGSSSAVQGKRAIGEAVAGFFESIAGSTHKLTNVLRDDATLVSEGEVTYRRHDDSQLTLPFTNVFELDGERIAHYKIYIDIGPLYSG